MVVFDPIGPSWGVLRTVYLTNVDIHTSLFFILPLTDTARPRGRMAPLTNRQIHHSLLSTHSSYATTDIDREKHTHTHTHAYAGQPGDHVV